MIIIFAIIGTCVSILLGIAAVFFTFGYLTDRLSYLYSCFVWRHEQLAQKNIGKRILQEAYWFSEDKKSMELIKSLGEVLRDNGQDYRIETVRKIWQSKVNDLSKV